MALQILIGLGIFFAILAITGALLSAMGTSIHNTVVAAIGSELISTTVLLAVLTVLFMLFVVWYAHK